MRKRGRVDENQTEIVNALRKVGASVEVTSMLGGGFPDLVVGFRGRNYLMEVKDGSKPPSRRRLTRDEENWHDRWAGLVHIVESVEQAIELLWKPKD